jgi:hypothetical protein
MSFIAFPRVSLDIRLLLIVAPNRCTDFIILENSIHG